MVNSLPICEPSSCDQMITAGNRARCEDCLTEALDHYERALSCAERQCASCFSAQPDASLSRMLLGYQKVITVLLELECRDEAQAHYDKALRLLDELSAHFQQHHALLTQIAHHRALFERKAERWFQMPETTTGAPDGAPVMTMVMSYGSI